MGHGFVDPFALMARLQRFAQPSEVAEPIELLRTGVAMHARGLINSRVIQNNLDWIWPYWVCRQVDPADPSFLPRAFSLTQINLTHRNWTAVGLPDCIEMPIVDPRGLVTPLLDGWSVDAWILADDGRKLFPSRLIDAVADPASPTGQWPEAIHPHTLGGCMGDGQHGWAAAEWVMMMRNSFVREEADTLVPGAGVRLSDLRDAAIKARNPAGDRVGRQRPPRALSRTLRGQCPTTCIAASAWTGGSRPSGLPG